ncbi:unnamed protein product [Coregonus sp. 'balchen']|nr:unnamed protein product [Coregonus sp. 'balchen']
MFKVCCCVVPVVLPPEKAAEGCNSYLQYPHSDPDPDRLLLRGGDAGKASGKKRISLDDMSSLMHTIYDVVDASVNHSSYHSERKTLRVKLTVTPEPSARRRDHTSTGPDRESSRLHQEEGRSADRRLSPHIRPAHPGQSSEPPSPEGQHYCVDENTERRNHYLDLAGIENYTSRFEGSTPPPPPQETHVRTSQSQNRSRSQEPEAHAAHSYQRRSQVIGENYTPLEARGRSAAHFLKSPKGTSKGAGGGGTNGGIERGKSSKCHGGGYYPPHPPHLQTVLHTGNSSSGGHGGQDVYHLPISPTSPCPPPATTSTLCSTATANGSGPKPGRVRACPRPKRPCPLTPIPSISSRLPRLLLPLRGRGIRGLARPAALGPLCCLWCSVTSTTTTTNTTTTTTTTITTRHDPIGPQSRSESQ